MSKKTPLKVIAGASDRPLIIGDIEIPCYVLEDETRVLTQRGMVSGLGMARGSAGREGGDRLAGFLSGKSIFPYVSNNLKSVISSPILFRPPTGGTAYGYPAILLADICDAVIEARNVGVLQKQQEHIVNRCEILMRGFARIGIIALVDEATGYQEIRDRQALHKILDAYLLSEHAKWAKRFPDEFYRQIFRLRRWQWQGMKVNRPKIVGRYTNDIVWNRLAPGIRMELEQRNPKNEIGRRVVRHHQYLTDDIGHPALQAHLHGVIALLRASSTWDGFKRNLQRAYPMPNEQLPLALDDD